MYGLIWLTDLRSKMDSIDLLIMLTSAVCHDLDHTGYNNAYQVNEIPSLCFRRHGFPCWATTQSGNLVLMKLYFWQLREQLQRAITLWLWAYECCITEHASSLFDANQKLIVFQINARTELALRYNDISPLENHHCAVAFEILEKVKKDNTLFKSFILGVLTWT